MATISTTLQIPSSTPGFNPWTSKASLDTTSGAITFAITDSFGKVVYQGDTFRVQQDITSNSSYNTDASFFSNLQSTVANQSQILTSQYNDLVPPAPSEPLPPAATQNQPNSNALAASPADEDNGQGQANTAESGAVPSAPNASATGQGGTTGGTSNVTQGADGQATSNDTTFSTAEETPGKRLNNPLGNFSSYTYQLSLYMITPDAYDAFVASGRRRINIFNEATAGQEGAGGAFLIAQSGGINNASSKRAPGFEFDYGIDNLTLTTLINGKATESESNSITFTFNIIEPYGFSFLSKLRSAADAIAGYSEQIKDSYPENPSKQFFILGIRFFGYDEAGNVINGKETYDGNTLDPNSVGNGLFETFYDITINTIKFKLDGKATVYNVEATSTASQAAFSIKRGLLLSGAQVEASTVGEAIDQLLAKLNKEQQDAVDKSIRYPNTYKVVYLNDADTIANASLVSDEDLDKYKFPSSGVKSTTQSNDAASFATRPDVTRRTATFKAGTPILQAINNIVTQSSFLRDALKVVYTTAVEPAKTKGLEENKPNTNKKVQWYNCSAEISNARWDDKILDWAYDITYIIQTYQTPVIDSIYANPGQTYYGPFKRYEYWYGRKGGTGNSEVLSYSQNLDNTYFTVVLGDPPSDNQNKILPEIATRPGLRTNRPRLGKLGNGMEAQNNYLTSLFDLQAYASAKVTIMGDPDFLMQPQASSENDIYNRFYGTDGFTANPNGGQVYIEIDFQEAVDYESETGVLKLNDSILFFKYPDSISKKVKGVSYTVLEVQSSFVNGSFKQVLSCINNSFPDIPSSGEREDSSGTGAGTNSGPAPGNKSATTNTIGLGVLKKEFLPPTTPAKPAYSPTSLTPSYIPQPVTTPAGYGVRVADDDGNG